MRSGRSPSNVLVVRDESADTEDNDALLNCEVVIDEMGHMTLMQVRSRPHLAVLGASQPTVNAAR